MPAKSQAREYHAGSLSGEIMRKLLLITTTIAVLGPASVSFAQGPGAPPSVSVETRQMCREAVLKICNPGSPPSRDEVRRCAAKNVDKLPPDCALLLAASAQHSR